MKKVKDGERIMTPSNTGEIIGEKPCNPPGVGYSQSMKMYVIRTQDIFKALAAGQLPGDCFRHIGTVWADVALTDEQRKKYTFPIDLH